jgi:hypothetical protein
MSTNKIPARPEPVERQAKKVNQAPRGNAQFPGYQKTLAAYRVQIIQHLANYICHLPGKAQRREFMANWKSRHGQTSHDDLHNAVDKAWQNRHNKAA